MTKREVTIDARAAHLEFDGTQLRFDDLEAVYEVQQIAPGHYSVLLNGRSFRVAIDDEGNAWVNGRTYRVETFDPRDRRADAAAGASAGRQQIASPMPGKIVRVLVRAGDEVEAGQGLVVVEAMKMQNEMVSPKTGRVAEVRAQEGATVRAGEILLVVE